MVRDWIDSDGKRILMGLACPLDWSHINSTTHISLLGMLKPDLIYLDSGNSGDIAEKREGQCETAMKMGCTHVFMADGDMVYPPTILVDMFEEINNGADMVGGLCYRGAPPYDPLIWHPTEERKLVPFRDYQFGDVVDAGATGAACLLVKKNVFEKMEQPWFRIQREEITNRWRPWKKKVITILRRGEDTYFTRNATKAGFKLKVVTKEDIGHMREFQVDRHFWLIFGIINALGRWEVIAELYKKLQDPEWVRREFGSSPITKKQEVKEGGS